MANIILDVSNNTIKGDIKYFEKMVHHVKSLDSEKYNIIFKTQLFSSWGKAAKANRCLSEDLYTSMNKVCRAYGYKLTSSVFDIHSLNFLLRNFDVPFVKIACRKDLRYLISFIPRGIPVYISFDIREKWGDMSSSIWEAVEKYSLSNFQAFSCIPEYPANEEKYIATILTAACCSLQYRLNSVSDHTKGLEIFKLWKKHLADTENASFEVHYVLDKNDKGNPDAGPFAKDIGEIKEMI